MSHWRKPGEALGQITAPHFCAGIVFVARVCTEPAPILRYMRGWTVERVRDYCATKQWGFQRVA